MTDVSPYTTTMDLAVERRKRRVSEEESPVPKRPRMSFYIRLESESSRASDDDDTESVYSIQDKETDVARDSSDTEDPDSEVASDSGAELVTLEYDVASLSSDGADFLDYTSSGTEDMNKQAAAEGALAAVLLETSLEPWETAGDTSDGSTIFDAFDYVECRRDFWTCLQCKMHNDNPAFRYCDKCFQVRKTFFPPRPRPTRKRKHNDESNDRQRVKVDTLRTCLQELTDNPGGARDLSAASSSQIPSINFEEIVVPEKHLMKRGTSESSDAGAPVATERTPDVSDSEAFEDAEATPPKKRCTIDRASECCSQDSGIGGKMTSSQELTDDSHADSREPSSSSASSSRAPSSSPERAATNPKRGADAVCERCSGVKPESDSGVSSANNCDDMCMMCTSATKNGLFLHGSIAHRCCCYKCAMRVWKTSKRCPVCNCKVKNVVKLFTS